MTNEYFLNENLKWLGVGLICFLLLYYFLFFSRKRLRLKLSYDPQELSKPVVNLAFLRWIPFLLQCLALWFVFLALARPQSSTETVKNFSEGIDIMLLLDTSGSMETDDFKPNRLEVAKEKATEFISGRLDDRIGIVLFAEDAFSYAPLTLDYELLKKQIHGITSNIMPKEGTAMGSAIAIGINRMQDSDSPSRIMILLTDGASNRGQIEPVVAAKLAQERGIKIYCIGIGKKEYFKNTLFGRQRIPSDLDEETLQKIAKDTGGQFFRSTDERGLANIFEQISQMEKTEILEERFRDVSDLYPQYLLTGIILFVVAMVLMVTPIYNPLEQ